jgi:hypothetical protein
MKRPALLLALGVTSGLAAAGGLALWTADPFTTAEPVASASTATATIVRSDLVSQIVLDATLGYAGTYTIGYPAANSSSQSPIEASTSNSNQPSGSRGRTPPARNGHSASGNGTPSTGRTGPSSGGGTMPAAVTALPQVGQVISQGQALFAVNGTPTVLLYGSGPPWRTLTQGTNGPDVTTLNADLVALGDATAAQLDSASDSYSAATTTAVKKLQGSLGTTQTGTLTLGQAAFEPTPMRVTNISATLGGRVPAGGPILTATSTTRLIIATIDASQRSELHAGDAVTIILADGTITPGKVTSIGTDAVEPSSNGPPDSTPPPPTVAATITPTDPVATGTVDQVPVIAAVTIASVHNALAVPVASLVSTSGGHPAINVLDAAGTTRSLPVTLGIFDDANGLVQIIGPGISAGETITLPAQLRA